MTLYVVTLHSSLERDELEKRLLTSHTLLELYGKPMVSPLEETEE